MISSKFVTEIKAKESRDVSTWTAAISTGNAHARSATDKRTPESEKNHLTPEEGLIWPQLNPAINLETAIPHHSRTRIPAIQNLSLEAEHARKPQKARLNATQLTGPIDAKTLFLGV